MLHEALADTLRAETIAPGCIRPAWNDYCFANVPDTVLSLFGNGSKAVRPLPDTVLDGVTTEFDHVVLAFVDGFGWNHFQRVRHDHSFLTRLTEHATVTPLTAGYPSETAAAVSTIHTGHQPCEHGVLGWNAHVPSLGGYIQTLPFTDHEHTPLGEVCNDPDPADLIDESTLYERLDARSVLIQPTGINENPYNAQVTRGAELVNHENPAQAAYRVRAQLEGTTEPTYCYCYLSHVDTFSHTHGVIHEETDAQLASVCRAIEREIIEKLDPAIAERTLLLVLADHGEIDTTPPERINVGSFDLDRHLQRDEQGAPIPVVGGPRNLQFYAREGHRNALRTALEDSLAPLDPLVLDRERIIDEDLFGDREPSDRFKRRCPDVLVVPRTGFARDADDPLTKVGMHGGLHPDEMLIPFAAARIDTLQE